MTLESLLGADLADAIETALRGAMAAGVLVGGAWWLFRSARRRAAPGRSARVIPLEERRDVLTFTPRRKP